jgi:uncharacterized membrane protein
MSGVDWITQETPTRTHWVTSIGGIRREFDATITEQQPGERVAWRADNGPTQAGVVTFHRPSNDTTWVHLQLELEPEGVAERAGAVTGVLGRSLQGDLVRLKEFIEGRAGQQTGGWRGTVEPEPQDNQALGHTPGRAQQ